MSSWYWAISALFETAVSGGLQPVTARVANSTAAARKRRDMSVAPGWGSPPSDTAPRRRCMDPVILARVPPAADHYQRAREARPGIDIPQADFERFLAERLPTPDPGTAHVEDLYVACACAL